MISLLDPSREVGELVQCVSGVGIAGVSRGWCFLCAMLVEMITSRVQTGKWGNWCNVSRV
jgi:hypothetical protein